MKQFDPLLATMPLSALSIMVGADECASRDAGAPNVIVIMTDDQGYADVGPFGAKGFETPNVDRMARRGMILTDWYSAAPSSTPSRAALMTGCYPQRVGMPFVVFPHHERGLDPNEMTLAEVFRAAGYATGCVGKWHLGHRKGALPLQHGFDTYFGLPYSNDMKAPGHKGPALVAGNEVIEYAPDQSQLTTRYTEFAVDFIDKNKEGPFFLYFAHSMPHVPLAVSDKFKGKSEQGLYGDVIMEIDWSIGQLFGALARNGIEDNTWVIYISDNGPWLRYGNHGGSAGPLREGKGTTFDGGQRTFCLMTWPGVIPAGSQCREVASHIDILPTAANYLGVSLPGHTIDGRDIMPLITGAEGAKSPHEAFYYYNIEKPEAIRVGDWKLVLAHQYKDVDITGKDGRAGRLKNTPQPRGLYNLREDICEKENLVEVYPAIARKMEEMLLEFDAELKANGRPFKRYAE